MDKVSYALGMSIGNNLLGSGIKQVDYDDFMNAIKTTMAGGVTEMTFDEAKQVLDKFFTELAERINAQNIAVGKEFLKQNKEREEVVELLSGLQYEVLREGKGAKPGPSDKVQCHYEGRLIDGTVFDSSYKRGEPAVFGVNQVIKGWVEALQLMGEGAKWRLYIPSDLAYGARGAGQSIPPHATLVFDVELLKVIK